MPTYVDQAHVATADLWSAADHNQLLDNIASGVPALFSAAGDLIYATASKVAARLAIGTAGYMLRSTGTLPAWSNIGVPQVSIVTSDQTVSSSTTLVDATSMSQAVGANENWIAMWACFFTGTGNLKSAVNTPTSPTTYYGQQFIYAAAGYSGVAPTATPDGTLFSGNLQVSNAITFASLRNGANAGNFVFRFAQFSAANSTVLKAGSFMLAIRMS